MARRSRFPRQAAAHWRQDRTAARRVIAEPVRAPGTIQLDERRIVVISLRAEAFIDSVEDVTTGSEVRKGQPLLRFYSPGNHRRRRSNTLLDADSRPRLAPSDC